MKTTLLLFSLLFIGKSFQAQDVSIYSDVQSLLIKQHPEISLNDKLIALQIWSSSDESSRACNKAFEKAYTTYYMSKLKGGTKGLIVLVFNKENLDEMSVITLGKDGIKNCLSHKLSDLNTSKLNNETNLVYDSQGKLIYSNLSSETIFSTFQSLITR